MNGAGDMVCASSVPGWCCPGSAYINSLTSASPKVRRAWFSDLLTILAHNQNVECPVTRIINKGNSATLCDRYMGDRKR